MTTPPQQDAPTMFYPSTHAAMCAVTAPVVSGIGF
jgi:hypothetical protein